MSELSVIGKSYNRKDSLDKVTGKAKFASDLYFDDMVYGAVKRSTIASGYIKSINLEKAKNLDGVLCVLTHKDIIGDNRVGIIIKDEPILVDDKVRRYEDAIALVAAKTKEIAQKAVELIEVTYEEIEPIFTIEDALREDAHKIHGNTNILQKKQLVRGDVDEAFKRCDVIVEKIYETQPLAHMFIEPEAGIAKYENGIMTVWSSTQNPHFDRGEVARMLNLPQNKVRSIQATTGGGFGGKLDISVQCHAALLAYYTKKPVKMVNSREESMNVSSKRHPMKIKAKTGATKDGKILATEVEMLGDTGAYASYGPAVITRALVHCTGPYNIDNVRAKATFVYTNNPMSGAFRGFGVPQASVVHEGQIDEIAKQLNMDRVEIRRKNAQTKGSKIATGQILTNSVGIIPTIDSAVEKAREVIDYDKSETCKNGKLKGIGIGSMWYGVGNTGLPNPSSAFVEVHQDGSATVLTGCADIGQGSDTVMAQIVAEELGLNYEDVRVISADTGVTPEAGATSASRQTYISGNACRIAAKDAKKILLQTASDLLNTEEKNIVMKERKAFCKNNCEKIVDYSQIMNEMKKMGRIAVGSGYYNPNTKSLTEDTMSGIPYEAYSYATTIAEVEVDKYTGYVEVKKVVSSHDVGQVINKTMLEGQIEGGTLMGMGFALLEEVLIDKGRIKNNNFSHYIIQTMMDIPEIYPVIVEENCETGPFGAKGVGEPALIPIISAVASAIEDAVGVRFTKFPIKPQDIVAALNK